MRITTICVCGAGTMGTGIAQVAAQAGYRTILYELNTATLDRAKTSLNKSLQLLSDKKKISPEEQSVIMDRIVFTSDLQVCLADVFIEAIVEKPAIKTDLFNELARINPPHCIFASNTSSLSITDIAGKVMNPERVIGMHFFNPAPLMKLVEVVNTSYTSLAVTDTMVALTRSMGKTPVVCKDAPGFIVNRVARPYYIESLRLAEEGVAIAQVDDLLEATGFRMGPFKLMDLIGHDVNYAVSCSVYEQLHQPERLKPSFIQHEKVLQGKLGKKTGEGFYDYRVQTEN